MPDRRTARQRSVGPSSAVRLKAIAAKRENQEHRIRGLRRILTEIELKLTSGSLQPKEVTHYFIFTQAGLSRATYWRFLKVDDELRTKSAALTGTAGRGMQDSARNGRQVDAQQNLETPYAAIRRLEEQVLAIQQANVHLKQQIAAAKALIRLLNIDLRAKTKETESKNVLLAGARESNLRIVEKLRDVVETCRKHGISVDVELSAFVRQLPIPRTRKSPAHSIRSKRPPELTVIDGNNER